MKKIILTAMALFAIIIFAPGAGAAQAFSQNVVGYTKINLEENGFSQFGIQFQNVGSENGTLDFLSGTLSFGLAGYDWSSGIGADYVQIWNVDGQGYSTTYFWSEISDKDYISKDNVWFDEGELELANVAFSIGSSLFLNTTQKDANITIFGEVSTEPVVLTLKEGFTQFTNPYPIPIQINEISFTGLTGYDWGSGVGADYVQIWYKNNQGYSTTYFWSEISDKDYVLEDYVWFDEGELGITNYEIPVGGSVFLFRQFTEKGNSEGSASFYPPVMN